MGNSKLFEGVKHDAGSLFPTIRTLDVVQCFAIQSFIVVNPQAYIPEIVILVTVVGFVGHDISLSVVVGLIAFHMCRIAKQPEGCKLILKETGDIGFEFLPRPAAGAKKTDTKKTSKKKTSAAAEALEE